MFFVSSDIPEAGCFSLYSVLMKCKQAAHSSFTLSMQTADARVLWIYLTQQEREN